MNNLHMTIESNTSRRRFLLNTSIVVGAAGLTAAAWPFIASLNPSERARQAGASIRVDFSKIEAGRQVMVEWRQKPVWLLQRTQAMLEKMDTAEHLSQLRDPNSEVISQQPAYVLNATRSLHPEHLVVIGICTHLGCVPIFRPDVAPQDLGPDWIGGYFCPCHGSRFDLAGRVFKGVPAPTNLVIPPYYYVSESVIEIGVDSDEAIGSVADKAS